VIDGYMNQSVIWKSKGDVNEYNEPTYTGSTIQCRFEYKRRLVRNKQGQEVISEARLFTSSPVKPDDLITHDSINWVVIAVADQPNLDGSIEFYEVMM
jgi:hypothetical protein